MAWGVGSILSMGVGALFNSQAHIQTTGNNISNVNTQGYSRQAVRQEEAYATNARAGQVGQGVSTKEVFRYFDAFLESNYLEKISTSQRFESQYGQLRYVENIFNESNVSGISNSLTELWKAWNKLSQQPNSLPTREALLGTANTLATTIRNTDTSLAKVEEQLDAMIKQDVDTANQLIQEIAALNKEITLNYQAGRNNPNALMDKRDQKVRELAAIIDVDVEDRGPGHYNLSMRNGYTLVQDHIPFSLELRTGNIDKNITADSEYRNDRSIRFSGNDYREYTIQIENPGTVGAGAQFKVSLDGGKTWLSDDQGNPLLYDANEEGGSVRAGNLDIWFDAGDLSQGDTFVISPKTDVFWVSPTTDAINISPQIYGTGTDNALRMTGGSLAGILEFRDYQIGEYRTRLDAFSKELIWQVNSIHSNGAGLEPLKEVLGTYSLDLSRLNVPLGSPEALFTWADKLQAGNMTFMVYNQDGSAAIPYPGLNVFSDTDNFDPATHSMEDVLDAIKNASFTDENGNTFQPFAGSEIADGKLHIRCSDPFTFAATADSTGLAAAFGLNTFFTGHDAGSLGLNTYVTDNLNLINAGRVNGAGELNSGDNQTAYDIANLANSKVTIGTLWNKATTQSLGDHYSTLYSKVGSDTQSVKYTAATETAMALDLYDRSEQISGVSLDEEMSSLIKFQASYKAAAKLITTADEMLQTLLSLKQ